MNKEPATPILARYGETARQIKIAVWNSEDETTISLDNYSVTMQLYKPDGNFVIKPVTPSSGKVTITLDEQCTSVAGMSFLDLKISDANGVIYTCHALVLVDTPVANDDVIESLSMVNGYIFPDDFQLKLTAGEAIYFSGDENRTINARATALSAGEGISIEGNTISIDTETIAKIDTIDDKQNELIAGEGISIDGDTISCTVSSPDWELIGTLNYTVANAQAHVELTKSFNSIKELLLVITQQSNGALWATQLLRTGDLFVEQEIYFPISTNTSIRSTSFTFTSNTDLKCTYSGEGANKVLKVYGR